MGDLTVAIKLVTEKIGNNDRFGLQLTENGSGSGFITLNDGVFFLCLACKCAIHHKFSEDPAHQVSSRAVCKINIPSLGKGLFNHAAAGGFPIGSGYGYRTDRSGKKGKQIRTDLHGKPTGHGCAASVQKSAEPPQSFTDQDCQNSAKWDLHICILVQKWNNILYHAKSAIAR